MGGKGKKGDTPKYPRPRLALALPSSTSQPCRPMHHRAIVCSPSLLDCVLVSHDDSCSPSRCAGADSAVNTAPLPAQLVQAAAGYAPSSDHSLNSMAPGSRQAQDSDQLQLEGTVGVVRQRCYPLNRLPGPACPWTNRKCPRKGWAARPFVSHCNAPLPLDCASGERKTLAFSPSSSHLRAAEPVGPPSAFSPAPIQPGVLPGYSLRSSIIHAHVFVLAISLTEPGPTCKWPPPWFR